MQIIQAALLGLVQGLTEFIPVSSSGHLILAEKLFHFPAAGLLFDVSLHVGTLLVLVVYFRRDLINLIKSIGSKTDRLWLYIIVGTIPAIAAGMWLQDLENSLRSVNMVAVNLALVAGLMLVVEKLSTGKELRELKSSNALVIGAAQALALVPGVSRSGITIIAGMGQGFKRAAAARFTFLLAIPITAGAILKLLSDGGVAEITSNISVFAAGCITAAVSGYLAIDFLMKYLSKRSLAAFAYYRLALAAIILLVILVK